MTKEVFIEEVKKHLFEAVEEKERLEEKLKLTKELKGKVEIIDDKYVYVEREGK